MKISDAEKLREGFTKGREPELDFVKENPKAERRERMDSRLKDMVSRQGKACLENRQGHMAGAKGSQREAGNSFFFLIYSNWRLTTLQYCSVFLPYIDMNQSWVYVGPSS